MILEAVCVMPQNVFLLEMVNMVKSRGNSTARWVELCFFKATIGGGGQKTVLQVYG